MNISFFLFFPLNVENLKNKKTQKKNSIPSSLRSNASVLITDPCASPLSTAALLRIIASSMSYPV